MPASLQRAIASFASLRGGSTMPTSASSVSPCTSSSSVAAGVEGRGVDVARGDGEHAQALAGETIVLRQHAIAARSSDGHGRAVDVADVRRAGEQDVGRALDEAAHDRAARRPPSRGTSPSACTRSRTAPRRRAGTTRRVSSTSRPPFAASTTSAASVGSPTISPSRTDASLASAIGRRNGSRSVSDSPATRRILPVGRVALALDRVAAPATTSCRAVIWFSVSVPVLSEQIADVAPSVSTDRRRLTIAPLAASACVPSDSMVVTTAGRPVGMAAIARLIPIRNSSSKSSPRSEAEHDDERQRGRRP